MLRTILKHKWLLHGFMTLTLSSFLMQLIAPHQLMAQASGPGQTESQGFSGSGASEMVDLFSGDLNYSIPLMEVDGYPLVLGYNADVRMDQEASWVGLGWSLNPGALSRGVRGLPDDFESDIIKEENSLKAHTDRAGEKGAQLKLSLPVTYLIDQAINALSAGATSTTPIIEQVLSLNLGLDAKAAVNIGQNSYTKSYIDLIFDNSYNLTASLNPQGYGGLSPGLIHGNGLGLSLSSRSGIGINPSTTHGYTATFGVPGVATISGATTKTIGANYSTRAGLSQVAVTQSNTLSLNVVMASVSFTNSGTSVLFPGTSTYTAYTPTARISTGSSFLNKDGLIVDQLGMASIYSINNKNAHVSTIIDTVVNSKARGFLYHHKSSLDDVESQLLDFNRNRTAMHVPATIPELRYGFQTQDNYIASGSGMNIQFQPHRNDIGHVYDPTRISTSDNQTFVRRVALSPQGKAVSSSYGTVLSKAANLIINVPPFIDEFILKGGFYVPFEFENGNGKGTGMTITGGWHKPTGNESADAVRFREEVLDKPAFEPYYFKAKGEMGQSATPLSDALHDESPKSPYVGLSINGSNPEQSEIRLGLTSSEKFNEDRVTRNTMILQRTHEEAARNGFVKSITSYGTINPNGTYSVTSSTSKTSSSLKAHHLSEFEITQVGGSRYIYGTPVYNNVQREVAFSVNPKSVDACALTTSYIPNIENSRANPSGKMNYFKSTETPAYASTFLLDAVLSPDYVDVDGNGITDNDLGSYTRFRYNKVQADYKWRVPYSKDAPGTGIYPRAAYAEGSKNFDDDDIASYVYGEKELWYVHSIEGKEHIAEFYITPRKDGFGVMGENGELDDDSPLYKLDKIALYSKKERAENGHLAEPVKVVHFEYDYSLCTGIPSNDLTTDVLNPTNTGGKLTLKKIYFTYGNSEKGALSPYEFTYTNNYNYQAGAVDRWGVYKPHNCPSEKNQEFPYTDQSSIVDNYARAWKLSQVYMPSGSTVYINYESDKYSKVQHLEAARMMQITGFGKTPVATTSNDLFIKTPNTYSYNDYVYFELDEPLPPGTPDSYIKQHYLKEINQLYFRVLGKVSTEHEEEFYNGYAAIDGFGLCPPSSGDFTHGYIRLLGVPIVDQHEATPELPTFVELLLPNGSDSKELTNPIAKAGWQHLRLNLKRILYPEINCQSLTSGGGALGAVVDQSQIQQIPATSPLAMAVPNINGYLGLASGALGAFSIQDMFAIFNCLKQYLTTSFGLDFASLTDGGLNIALRNKKFAAEVNLNQSHIKLSIPSKEKYGGGYRVTKITTTDAWDHMGGDDDHIYGQDYDYSMVDEDGDILSSGIATYEPAVGNDENPWRKPQQYTLENTLYPDDHHYIDLPVGEPVFPAPSVGYRQVKVQNLQHPKVVKTATGWKEYEFYTAADFPIRVYKSELTSDPFESTPDTKSLNPLKDRVDMTVDILAVAQGFSVVLNDMHGKPRARRIYNQSGDLKNSVTYHYKSVDGDVPGTFKLDNEVQTYNESGNVVNDVEIGTEYDVTFDSRHSYDYNASSFKSKNYNISINFSFNQASHTQKMFKLFGAGTLFKLKSQSGVLERVEVKDGSSTIIQKNRVFDKLTGNPVFTTVQNDYDSNVRGFSYPAYWMHKGMGHAYKNAGLVIGEYFDEEIITHSNGNITSAFKQYFYPGDELELKHSSSGYLSDRYWIVQSGSNYKIVDRNGNVPSFFSGTYEIKVLRSGRRNQLYATAGDISSLKTPLSSDSALTATAMEYSDEWQAYCGIRNMNAVASGDTAYEEIFLDFFNALLAGGEIPYSTINLNSSINSINANNYPFHLLYSALVPGYQNCTTFHIEEKTQGNLPNFSVILSLNCDGTSTQLASYTGFNVPSGLTMQDISHLGNIVSTSYTGSHLNILNCYAYYTNGDSSLIQLNEMDFPIGQGECSSDSSFCGPKVGDVMNPYVMGIKGSYRPHKSYAYYSDHRKVKQDAQIKKDGMFRYTKFWRKPSGSWKPIHEVSSADSAAKHWLLTQEITRTDPYGNVLETKDALGLHSASIYGYDYNRSIASAANAHYREIAFDGFEDYDFATGSCNNGHFNFRAYAPEAISSDYAHTGKRSFALSASSEASTTRPLNAVIASTSTSPTYLKSQECVGTFSPYNELGSQNKYVLEYWQKLGVSPGDAYDYVEPDIEIEVDCNVLTPEHIQRSNIIDGWQRIEKHYSIPTGPNRGYITVRMKNDHTSEIAYFDDIRIHPIDASMSSSVYDPYTLRLAARLDSKNFATFYEYDKQGKVVAIRKETERGIYTLSESRSGVVKK